MIKEIDQLLQHWADQINRRGSRQTSVLGKVAEFGGIPPRNTGAPGSRDPLGLGEMDEVAWQVEQALCDLPDKHQVMAHEHYRWSGYSDEKSRRLGMARQTYYDRLDRLHVLLKSALQSKRCKLNAG
ncbi:hypothetical protein R84981_000965 [Carnimonas sp. R-84981]|uniref:hypothetical protein n=1 Tax=Carnimonas bestiolae TaxID=3402172 RepID=UPI003EDBBBE3